MDHNIDKKPTINVDIPTLKIRIPKNSSKIQKYDFFPIERLYPIEDKVELKKRKFNLI